MTHYYFAYFPLFFVTFLSLHLLYNLIIYLRNRFSSQLHFIPSPPLPFWKQYTIGHDLLHYLLVEDSFYAAKVFNEWRRRYSPILQLRSLFGERIVYIFSERAIREVNISKQRSYNKSELTIRALVPLTGYKGLLVADGELHTRLRRSVSPAMHHESLMAVQDIFLEQGSFLAKRLGELGQSGGPVLNEVRAAAFTAIFETCLGKNAVSPKVMGKLQDAYFTVVPEPALYTLRSSVLQTIFWFLDQKHFSYREDLKEFIRDTIYNVCTKRIWQCENDYEEAGTPLVSLMVDKEVNTKLGRREMVETVMSFLVAGQVTSSIAVCWALYLMAQYPSWQTLLFQELENWSSDKKLETLDRLPLLDRIVQETIRLYPPLFYLNRKSGEAVELDGYKIPKDTQIRIPILALHRDEHIWGPDVHEFNPDRFLNQKLVTKTRMYYCPFLFGSKGCIGKRFALLEIKAFIAQTLLKHKVTMKPEDPVPKCWGPFATPNGLKLYFEKRESCGGRHPVTKE